MLPSSTVEQPRSPSCLFHAVGYAALITEHQHMSLNFNSSRATLSYRSFSLHPMITWYIGWKSQGPGDNMHLPPAMHNDVHQEKNMGLANLGQQGVGQGTSSLLTRNSAFTRPAGRPGSKRSESGGVFALIQLHFKF